MGYRFVADTDTEINLSTPPPDRLLQKLLAKASFLNYEGEPEKAYAELEKARRLAESAPARGP